MKIYRSDTTLVYDIVDHMLKKGMTPEEAGYLRFVLEDNIMMYIKIDGKLYQAPWRYWVDYVNAFANCCAGWDEDTLTEVSETKKLLLQNAISLTDHAIDF